MNNFNIKQSIFMGFIKLLCILSIGFSTCFEPLSFMALLFVFIGVLLIDCYAWFYHKLESK